MYNEDVKQSYNEQPNPPTDEATTTAEVETLSEAELQALNTMWACIASEVGYGDYDTEDSLVDKITSLETAISGKAATSHAHPATDISGFATVATSGSYNDLTNKPTIPTVPSSLPANGGNADTVDNKHASDFATASHTHSQYASTSHTHAQSDITGLSTALSGKANTSHTHAQADVTGLADALSGKANTSHTHDYAASSHTHTQSEVTGLSTALSGKANTSHTHDYAASSHSHAQADITGLATALSGKSDTSHNHDSDYIAKALQMTADNGCVEYEMADQDVLAVFESMPMGLHTGYCPVNSTNAPLSNEAWRFLMHKTGTNNYGWILAFGSYGSVYVNYVNGGTWRGWKNLVDGTSAPLWKHESNGGYYMTASQTVTPSKPLDKCRNGWMLLWSDYDPGTSTTNNADFCTTMIPKRNGVGSLWSGQGFFCTVPTYMTETTDVDNFHIKKVYVHNDKLVGYVGNNVSDRRDVVLRAVYEY